MRCGLCGSKRVNFVTKNSYSMKKGIVGAAMLGPVGAVAGINGNHSSVYHCMSCGQDILSILDEKTEREIDELLANGDIKALEKYRNRWKNIEFPTGSAVLKHYDETHASTSTVNIDKTSVDVTTNDSASSSIAALTEDELMNSIKDDISKRDLPYTEQELTSKYQINKWFKDVYASILKEGSAHAFWINGNKYVKVAKSLEDIAQFVQMTNAEIQNRTDISNINALIEDTKQIIKENNSIRIEDLISEFKIEHPEYDIPGNQYAFSSLVESVLDKMLQNKVVKYDGNCISLTGEVEHIEYLYKRAYEYAADKNEKALADARKYHWAYYNKIVQAFKNRYEIEVDDVELSYGDQLGRSKVYHFLEDMSRIGEVEKIPVEGNRYRSKYKKIVELRERYFPVDENDVTLLHKGIMGEKLLNSFKDHDNLDFSFEEILTLVNNNSNNKIIKNSEEEILLFIELLYYQQQQLFEHKIRNGENYWRFIDKEKEKYNCLTEEKQRYELNLKNLKIQLETAKEVHSRNLEHVEGLKYVTDPSIDKEIFENEEKLNELRTQYVTLQGMFKKKRREEVDKKIADFLAYNDKIKTEIEEKRKSAEQIVANELKQTQEPIRKIEIEIKCCEEKLLQIESALSKLNYLPPDSIENPLKRLPKDDSIEKIVPPVDDIIYKHIMSEFYPDDIVSAIKYYFAQTNTSLNEAKKVVDAIFANPNI
ncbi:hypothetical protein [Butyrivibrio sp. LC3010]|uniref:hypothetical protein n=1 Tax=Butyrivibrio sp. LC3010 TaxID=1280680 RepID=UPI00041B9ECF|nr:hypothetical protein [Butyrivibrio sp. LC3010]